MTEKSAKRIPLEEMMLAMDVVDTLRHRQELVVRELDVESRRQRLIEKLKSIYAAQGIDVTEAILAKGVRALEEDRFSYTPPPSSFSVKLAHWYINRRKWGKILFFGLLFVAVLAGAYYFSSVRPLAKARLELPIKIEQTYVQIARVAETQSVRDQAENLRQAACSAVESEAFAKAKDLQAQMSALLAKLQLSYQVRIVSRPNEPSGVWRIPDVNTNARNYYLIVEAIEASGERLTLPIASEEDGAVRRVTSWGIRVDKDTFLNVAADKKDDGIIQGNAIGQKTLGYLEPAYTIPTTGATINHW